MAIPSLVEAERTIRPTPQQSKVYETTLRKMVVMGCKRGNQIEGEGGGRERREREEIIDV
jgi:hypothetical protein